MRQFKKGLTEAIVGVLGGLIFSAFLSSFKESNLIPSSYVFIFTLVGLAGSIGTIFGFRTAGVLFTLGWIAGALAIRSVLSPFDFFVYIVAPIGTLIIRFVVYVRKLSGND